MRIKQSALVSMAAFLGLFSTLPALAADSDDKISWSAAPYLWAPGISLDVSFADANLGGSVDFSDILDKLDAAFMGYVEGGKGQWSVFADLTYVDISDTTERTLIRIDSRNKQLFLDAALAWHPGGIDAPFNVFGGLRYTGVDNRYNFTAIPNDTLLASRRSDDDYYDALIGARYRFDLSERWALRTRADTSFGDTEGTFLMRASLSYTVGQRRQNFVVVGYQYKQMEFEEDGVTTEMQLQGPVAGFVFAF